MDPLIQRARESVDVLTGKLNEPTLFSSTNHPAFTTPFDFLTLNTSQLTLQWRKHFTKQEEVAGGRGGGGLADPDLAQIFTHRATAHLVLQTTHTGA